MKTVTNRGYESKLIVQRHRPHRKDWVDLWTGSSGDSIDWIETSIMPTLQRQHPTFEMRLVEIVTESTTTFEVVS